MCTGLSVTEFTKDSAIQHHGFSYDFSPSLQKKRELHLPFSIVNGGNELATRTSLAGHL